MLNRSAMMQSVTIRSGRADLPADLHAVDASFVRRLLFRGQDPTPQNWGQACDGNTSAGDHERLAGLHSRMSFAKPRLASLSVTVRFIGASGAER